MKKEDIQKLPKVEIPTLGNEWYYIKGAWVHVIESDRNVYVNGTLSAKLEE